MRNKKTDVKEIYIRVVFEDGEKFETKNPNTMILSYQNFDMAAIEKKAKKTGKYPLPKGSDIGGIQIFGDHENVKFALFSLLNQVVDHLDIDEIIAIFSKVTELKVQKGMQKAVMEKKMMEAIEENKDNKKLPN